MTGNCHIRHPRFVSPTAKGTNQLLWGDWNKGNYGILVRAPDMFDEPETSMQETPLLPASFVHASLRASNFMYPATQQTSAGILIGSKFSMNGGRNDEENLDALVHSSVCYPSDAGSNKRMALFKGGTGCHPKGISGLCLNNTCLTTRKQNCACDSHDVPGEKVGPFIAEWLKWAGGKQHGLDRFMCWYQSNRLGLSETIAASNSLWLERSRWCLRERDMQYMGWTECPSTSNMRVKNLVDAIVVRLPVATVHNMSLCDYEENVVDGVQTALAQMKSLGYTDRKPVVFLEQVKGMMNQQECNDFWNGVECNDGYRKEIFSQEFNFRDGSCLAIPEGCKDVYHFAVDNATCIVSSEACREAERDSPYHFHHISISNARLLYIQEEASAAALEHPNFVAVSFVNMLALATSVGTFFFVWRKRGRRSRRN